MNSSRPGLKGGIGLFLFVTLGLLFGAHATSSTQNDRAPAIGIDLGSAYSRVAYARPDGYMNVVSDDRGNTSIPSCVAFTKDGPLIGDAARLWAIEDPGSTICNPRALLGRKWSDRNVQSLIEDLPYEVANDGQDRPVFKINVDGVEESHTPEYVTSLIIGELKRMAEATMNSGENVTEAVITVPSYYSDERRQAVKDAGKLAGVDVLRAKNEFIAAGTAYHSGDTDAERNMVIVDMGDTLDVAVLELDYGVFEILSSSHHDIGGEQVNERMVRHITKGWEKRTGVDLSVNPSDIRKLNLEVEKAKIALSSEKVTKMDLSFANSSFTETITRAKLETLSEELFAKVLETISWNLKEARLSIADIKDIIITGGLSNIPKLRRMIEEAFPGKTLLYGFREEAIVVGAARDGLILSGAEGVLCTLHFPDISPLDFGIETADGTMAIVAPQNAIPFNARMNFTTAVDGQSSMLIRVLEGQRVLAASNLVLGEFELPLTPAPAGVPRVEVTFKVGAYQELNVSATDLETKKTEYIVVGPDHRMWTGDEVPSDADFDRSFLGNWPDLHIDLDPVLRAQVNARIDLESYLAALKGRLTNREEWGTADAVRRSQLSAILGDVRKTQADLIKHRNTWEPEAFQQLKEDFSVLAKPFVGKLEYEVIRKVGGRVEKQHDEL
ncbi:HSP70-domain-containing protein [Xylaria grammica]|nr:HSP70-domain-containing protein [Xylaria grammica]